MKNSQKNLSHIIRSFEDAIGFDENDEIPNYEKFASSKKQIEDELTALSKKRQKHKDSRRTAVYFDDEF